MTYVPAKFEVKEMHYPENTFYDLDPKVLLITTIAVNSKFTGLVELYIANAEIFMMILFSANLAKIKPSEMAKSLCCLLILVNHALVAKFLMWQICLLKLFANKTLAKYQNSAVA